MSFHQEKTGRFAYYAESTAGTPPADWDASGTLCEAVAIDPSGITQSHHQDETLEERWSMFQRRNVVHGVKSDAGATSEHYLTGHGQQPAASSSATATWLSGLITHGMGGSDITSTEDITSGTTTTIEVASVTNWEEGAFVAVEDLTSPASADDGVAYIRRITDISGVGPYTVTLDEALPFTPANGDIARSCIAHYLDPDVQEDSTGASGRTMSLKIERAGDRSVWECTGCAATFNLTNLGRDQQPRISLEWMIGDWETYATVTKTTWTQSPTNVPARTIGVHTHAFVQEKGTTTQNDLSINALDVQPNIPRASIDQINESSFGMHARAGYTADAEQATTVQITTASHGIDWEDKDQANTRYTVRISQVAGGGYGWAIHMTNCKIVATPVYQQVGPNAGWQLTFQADEEDDNAGASTPHLWRSRIIIVQA